MLLFSYNTPKSYGLVYGNVGYVGFWVFFVATTQQKKNTTVDAIRRKEMGLNPTYPTFHTRLTIMVTTVLQPLVFYGLVYGNVGFA
jgi:Trk-type K+ transport system membrane component